jgi:hypothetical protein
MRLQNSFHVVLAYLMFLLVIFNAVGIYYL